MKGPFRLEGPSLRPCSHKAVLAVPSTTDWHPEIVRQLDSKGGDRETTNRQSFTNTAAQADHRRTSVTTDVLGGDGSQEGT